MRHQVTHNGLYRNSHAAMIALGLALAWSGSWPAEAPGKTIYSYIDDRGNPVYTDAPEMIPDRHKAGVKTHEQRSTDEEPMSVSQAVSRRLRGQIRDIRSAFPTFQSGVYGLTPHQSELATYGGLAVVVLLAMMYLGKSPFTRLLGLALLMILGVALPVLMYISDDGPAERMQKAATAAGQAQQERLQHASP